MNSLPETQNYINFSDCIDRISNYTKDNVKINKNTVTILKPDTVYTLDDLYYKLNENNVKVKYDPNLLYFYTKKGVNYVYLLQLQNFHCIKCRLISETETEYEVSFIEVYVNFNMNPIIGERVLLIHKYFLFVYDYVVLNYIDVDKYNNDSKTKNVNEHNNTCYIDVDKCYFNTENEPGIIKDSVIKKRDYIVNVYPKNKTKKESAVVCCVNLIGLNPIDMYNAKYLVANICHNSIIFNDDCTNNLLLTFNKSEYLLESNHSINSINLRTGEYKLICRNFFREELYYAGNRPNSDIKVFKPLSICYNINKETLSIILHTTHKNKYIAKLQRAANNIYTLYNIKINLDEFKKYLDDIFMKHMNLNNLDDSSNKDKYMSYIYNINYKQIKIYAKNFALEVMNKSN